MSLLDKFLILFETDSSEASDDVKKFNSDLDKTEQAANDAVDGMDSAADAAGGLGVSLEDAATKAAGLVAGFFAIGSAISTSMAVAEQTDELGKLAETYGLNIQQLDAWGAAVERNGGSAAELQNTVVGLQTQLDQVSMGGGTEIIETLGRMGIAANESSDSFDILTQVADRMQGMSAGKAASFGQMLGLDQGTILMLQQGRESVSQLVEQQQLLGGATNESYKASADFNDAMDNMDRGFTGLWQTINAAVLPVFTAVIETVTDMVMWFRQNEEFSVAFFVAIAAAITGILLPSIMSMTAAAAPFIAIGAAIAAVAVGIAALYEDVKAYMGGQESFVGNLAKKYQWFADILNAAIDGASFVIAEFSEFGSKMFDNLANGIQIAADIIKGVLGLIGVEFDGLGITAQSVVDFIIKVFSLVGDSISKTLDFIASPIEETKAMIEGLGNTLGGVKDFFGFGDDEESDTMVNTQKALTVTGAYNANPMNGMSTYAYGGARNTYNQNSFSFNNSISAKGVTPEQVSGQLNSEFGRQITAASAEFDDGEDY